MPVTVLPQPIPKSPVFRTESLPVSQYTRSDIGKMLLHNLTLLNQANQQLSAMTSAPRVTVSRTSSLNIPRFGPPHPPTLPSQINATSFTSLNDLLAPKLNVPSPLVNPQPAEKANINEKQGQLKNAKGRSPNGRNVSAAMATVQAATLLGMLDEHEDEEGKKQFFCRICNKDFRRPDILSRHLRRHTGEKPFRCDCCNRYFSRSDHLRTHRRTHTDEKPYKCTACPYSARRRDVLTRHMSTRHQQKAGKSILPKQKRNKQSPESTDSLNVTKDEGDTSEEEFIDVTNVDEESVSERIINESDTETKRAETHKDVNDTNEHVDGVETSKDL
jgi:uncharacterized Zn-finger protein